MYFELFCYYLPLEKDMMSPSPKHALFQAWLIFAWRFWENFQILSMYLRYFVSISHLEKGRGNSFEQPESPPSKMFCAKFGWNSYNGSRDFKKKLSIDFCYFLIISP